MNKLPPTSCERCENLLTELTKCLEAFKTFISVDSNVDPNILITSLEQLFKKSSDGLNGKSSGNTSKFKKQERSYRIATTQTEEDKESNPSTFQCKCQMSMVKLEPTVAQKKNLPPVKQTSSNSKKSGKKGKGRLRPKAFRSKNAYDFVPPETLKKASASVKEVSLDPAGSYKVYECVNCQRQFPRRANCQNHFLIMHEKQGVRCEKCRKMYFSKEVFRRHKAVCNVVNTWREMKTQVEEKAKSVEKASTSKLKSFNATQTSSSHLTRVPKLITSGLKSTSEPSPLKTGGGKNLMNKTKIQGKPVHLQLPSNSSGVTTARQRVTRDSTKRLVDTESETEFESEAKNTSMVNLNQNTKGVKQIKLEEGVSSSSQSSPALSKQSKKVFGNMVTKNKTTRNFLMENQNGKLSRVSNAGKKSPK